MQADLLRRLSSRINPSIPGHTAGRYLDYVPDRFPGNSRINYATGSPIISRPVSSGNCVLYSASVLSAKLFPTFLSCPHPAGYKRETFPMPPFTYGMRHGPIPYHAVPWHLACPSIMFKIYYLYTCATFGMLYSFLRLFSTPNDWSLRAVTTNHGLEFASACENNNNNSRFCVLRLHQMKLYIFGRPVLTWPLLRDSYLKKLGIYNPRFPPFMFSTASATVDATQ